MYVYKISGDIETQALTCISSPYTDTHAHSQMHEHRYVRACVHTHTHTPYFPFFAELIFSNAEADR